MNNDTTINIIMKGSSEEGSTVSPESPGGTPNVDNPENNNIGNNTKSGLSTAKAVGYYLAKQGISAVTSRVGYWTRDSNLGNSINNITKMVGYAFAFTQNPIMTTLTLGVDVITSTIDYRYNANKESNTLTVLNKRAGSVNRSRE